MHRNDRRHVATRLGRLRADGGPGPLSFLLFGEAVGAFPGPTPPLGASLRALPVRPPPRPPAGSPFSSAAFPLRPSPVG